MKIGNRPRCVHCGLASGRHGPLHKHTIEQNGSQVSVLTHTRCLAELRRQTTRRSRSTFPTGM